ncbi:Cd(II)/Pb(II)-sensing metalloregulatory transcriptional regulator CmtR [Agrococcus beijingensis]|uniref:Cd(II)/Pb(II)-sensing metalloregulatory transcriptional regulator CmtR n=1 Tax=Agrococcus beijingensis TaxID=3068634 RepID=UPI0027414ABB|nr:metalloregulator ArsR/SmtB family transcription factor [Agrococcus sp. REN33]
MITIATRVDVMQRLGRAMADEARTRILLSLLDAPGYPAELAEELDLTRSNVSNHLACLRGCGIVATTHEGRRTRYEIADPHVAKAIQLLLDAVVTVDDDAQCQDEGCTLGCCAGRAQLVQA